MSASVALFGAELRLLARNTTAWVTATLLPVGLGAAWAISDAPIGDGAGAIAVLQLMAVLVFTLHTVGVMALASRREQLVLKRWRSSAMSDRSILVGTLGVPTMLTLIQVAVLTTITGIVWNERPASVLLLAVTILIATATVAALTAVVAAVTRSAEHAMVTTVPLVLLLVAGTIVALPTGPGELGVPAILVPGAAATELIQLAWSGAPDGSGVRALVDAAAPALGASVLLTALASVWARRLFRWEPRV